MAKGPRRGTEITSRIRIRVVGAVGFWHAVATRAQTVEVTFLAAAVAYYAFLSLLPLLLLVLAVGSALGGEGLANALVAAAGDLLTAAGEQLVRDALENAAGRAGATILSLLLLLWSMLKVFRGLHVAFQKVYGVEEAASLWDQIRDGLVAVVGVGAGFGAMFAVGAVLTTLDLDPVFDVLGILILPSVLTVVFLPLFYVFPDQDLNVRSILPGTVFAALGWTVLQAGFQVYAANAGQYQAYGVLGGVLLLVIWFYFASIVLLLGAVVNVVGSENSTPPNGFVENRTGPVASEAAGEPGKEDSGDR
jgi:YihY family inner membrane protein